MHRPTHSFGLPDELRAARACANRKNGERKQWQRRSQSEDRGVDEAQRRGDGERQRQPKEQPEQCRAEREGERNPEHERTYHPAACGSLLGSLRSPIHQASGAYLVYLSQPLAR